MPITVHVIDWVDNDGHIDRWFCSGDAFEAFKAMMAEADRIWTNKMVQDKESALYWASVGDENV